MPMKKITIAIPGDLLETVDSMVAKEKSNRSRVIAEAIGSYVNGDHPPEKLCCGDCLLP